MPVLHHFDVPLYVEKESLRFEALPWHNRLRPECSHGSRHGPSVANLHPFDAPFNVDYK